MFEQLAIEQTPVAVQIYTQSYFESPKTSNPVQDRRAKVGATIPRSLEQLVIANRATSTATLADISERRHSPTASIDSRIKVEVDSLVDKTSNDRVTLLARKYAGKIDSEGTARLEILTERLNRLVPPVEATTIDRVAEVVAIAERTNAKVSALKAKYNV